MSSHVTKSTLICSTALFASAVALAQQGPESSIATSISYNSLTRTTGTIDELQMSAPPDPAQPAGAPQPFPQGNYPLVPDYSLTKIFGSDSTIIEIDAMCSGNAQLPELNQGGWPDLSGAESWMGITVTVDNDARGLPNSLVERRTQNLTGRDDPGADLITYYAEESAGLAPNLPGQTFLSQSAEDLGIGGASDLDIDALDYGIGVQSESRNSRQAVLFPWEGYFYFSLTPASAAAVNAGGGPGFAWYDPGPNNPPYRVAADERTVYEVVWDPSNGGSWSEPWVYRSAARLGLGAGDDIDAVAVDRLKGSVVFSTQPKVLRSQLLIHGKPAGSSNESVWALTDTDGGKVTTELGLRDPGSFTSTGEVDNVDSVCVVEPEKDLNGFYMAIPRALYQPGLDHMPIGLSVTRWTPSTTTPDVPERLVFHATLDESLSTNSGWMEFMYSVNCDDPSYPGTCQSWLSFDLIRVSAGTTSVPLGTDIPWWLSSSDVMVTVRMWDDGRQNIIGSSWISEMKL